MKKIITTLLLLIPFFGFSQTVDVKDSLVNKAKTVLNTVVTKTVSNSDQELDEEYTERPFRGKEERLKVTPYTGMTDHEEYNAKLKKPRR